MDADDRDQGTELDPAAASPDEAPRRAGLRRIREPVQSAAVAPGLLLLVLGALGTFFLIGAPVIA